MLTEVADTRFTDGEDVANGEQQDDQSNYRMSPVCIGSNCADDHLQNTPALIEETGPLGCFGGPYAYQASPLTDQGWANGGRHNSGSNFAFFDGHVKWMKGTSVSAGWNAAKPTNPDSCTGSAAAGTSGTMNGVPVTATYSLF